MTDDRPGRPDPDSPVPADRMAELGRLLERDTADGRRPPGTPWSASAREWPTTTTRPGSARATAPIDQAKKAVMDLFRVPLTALENAGKSIKGLLKDYSDEQEKKAQEEAEKLRKLAEKEAEAEKKKIDAKIERAKASGKEDKVEELEAQKEAVTPLDTPVVASQLGPLKGVSYRDKYTGEVVDFKALPDEYKLVNQSALDKVLSATKGKIEIPGVKVHKEKIVAA